MGCSSGISGIACETKHLGGALAENLLGFRHDPAHDLARWLDLIDQAYRIAGIDRREARVTYLLRSTRLST